MLDTDEWTKLIRGLIAATSNGKMVWQEAGGKRADDIGSVVAFAFTNQKPKVYVSTQKSATYELSSANGFGNAPFELRIWKSEGSRQVPVDSHKSSLDVKNPSLYFLNTTLENLWATVSSKTENGSELVDRLLGELGVE